MTQARQDRYLKFLALRLSSFFTLILCVATPLCLMCVFLGTHSPKCTGTSEGSAEFYNAHQEKHTSNFFFLLTTVATRIWVVIEIERLLLIENFETLPMRSWAFQDRVLWFVMATIFCLIIDSAHLVWQLHESHVCDQVATDQSLAQTLHFICTFNSDTHIFRLITWICNILTLLSTTITSGLVIANEHKLKGRLYSRVPIAVDDN